MGGDRAVERYRLLSRLLGAEGCRELLFGSCDEAAFDAFRSCAMGSSMPLVYFELPLLDEPRFDVQVCLNRSSVMDDRELPATAPLVLEPLLDWLRGSEDCPGVDLAFDVSSGEVRTPQVMALTREGTLRDVEGFFSAVGERRAIERYRQRTRTIPASWRAWYVGLAPQRQGCPIRLDYSVMPGQRQVYLRDSALFARDVRSMGYKMGDVQLEWCHKLMELPFAPNLQLDVLDDGEVGPALGYSLAMPHWGPARSREELAHGALEQAFSLMEEWGLSDSRWRQLAGCCVGVAVKEQNVQDDALLAVRCVPTFVKVRMTPERLLDAKVYLMCTMESFDPETRTGLI